MVSGTHDAATRKNRCASFQLICIRLKLQRQEEYYCIWRRRALYAHELAAASFPTCNSSTAVSTCASRSRLQQQNHKTIDTLVPCSAIVDFPRRKGGGVLKLYFPSPARTLPIILSCPRTLTRHRPAGPIDISNFGWPAVVAVAVVATTALALDFAAFRAAELNKTGRRPEPAASQQEQHHHLHQVANNGVRGGGGGGSDAVQVSVRPGRTSAASDAAESRVHRNRACVLALWILAAMVFHRWVREV